MTNYLHIEKDVYPKKHRLIKEYRQYTHTYNLHKASSKQRGVAFHLTYDQWMCVWLLSGKLNERGVGKDSYVMSRIKDTGGYEIGNVFIQKSSQNAKEATAPKTVYIWNDDEIEKACELFLDGKSFAFIAQILGRTKLSVRQKIYKNLPIDIWQAQLRLSSPDAE